MFDRFSSFYRKSNYFGKNYNINKIINIIKLNYSYTKIKLQYTHRKKNSQLTNYFELIEDKVHHQLYEIVDKVI